MKTTTKASIALALGLSFTACIGTGARNKQQPQGTPCVLIDPTTWNQYWSELTYDHDQTRNCPYKVPNSGDLIPFYLEFFVQGISNPGPWWYTTHKIRNNQGSLLTTFQATALFESVYPGTNGNLRAVIDDQFPAATGTAPYYRDSVHIHVIGGRFVNNYPWVAVLLPGLLESPASPPVLEGSSYVVSGYPQSWSASVDSDPQAYRFEWRVNGQLISVQTGQNFSATLTPGSHTVSLTVRRSDESVVSQTMSVTAVDCGGPDIC